MKMKSKQKIYTLQLTIYNIVPCKYFETKRCYLIAYITYFVVCRLRVRSYLYGNAISCMIVYDLAVFLRSNSRSQPTLTHCSYRSGLNTGCIADVSFHFSTEICWSHGTFIRYTTLKSCFWLSSTYERPIVLVPHFCRQNR